MNRYRGVFAIPVTPITADDRVDEDGLRRWVNFAIARGAHGIVAPVNASSFSSFADGERQEIVEVLVDEIQGRVPFVAGVTGSSRAVAVLHAQHARAAGADSVIAMPPYVHKAIEGEIVDYYRAIAEASELPVWVQNFIGPVGTPMPPRMLARLFNEIEGVAFLKEETEVATHVITALTAMTDKCLGIMGGKGGRFFLNEWKRGACGTMPAGHVPENAPTHVGVERAGSRRLRRRVARVESVAAVAELRAALRRHHRLWRSAAPARGSVVAGRPPARPAATG